MQAGTQKLLKWIGILLGAVVLGLGLTVGYILMFLPNVGPAPDLTVEVNETRLARGDYLVNHVMNCMSCHSERDWSLYGAPPKEGRIGAGGAAMGHGRGLPGEMYPPNITPAALGDWTDGEIFRALTTGVSRDGRALYTAMPYKHYAKIDESDLHAVIAYLRGLPPVEKENPASSYDFPTNFWINTLPEAATLKPMPNRSDKVAYGEYLVNAAACGSCHTPMEGGEYLENKAFSGGNPFPLPDGGTVYSANISPHPTSGIGGWTEDYFVIRFKMHADSGYVRPKVAPGEFNTEMPWVEYAGMEEEDLRAIYAYLKSMPPIENRVTKFLPKGK